MRSICLYFQVHQPFRHKKYSFFDIGNDHYYYDDYLNESILQRIANNCYLPVNNMLLQLINEFEGKFKLTFSISGIALDQFELYAPEVINSFRKLAKTNCVEFLAETYSHSLVALKNKEAFNQQVTNHVERIEKLFGIKPTVFRNTELVYSDMIGHDVYEMGFKGMLTEGAKHILGWKTPNYLYFNVLSPRLKLLLRNYKLSDDIAFRYSNKGWSDYPLTSKKYVSWLNDIDKKEEVVNLFMDYETFGEHQTKETGILEFIEKLPKNVFKKSNFSFNTPSEIVKKYQPVASVSVPFPISWADEERDLTAWLGNEMQKEAFDKLYAIYDKILLCEDSKILRDWDYLQTSDYFYYMSTKWFSDGVVHSYFNPYNSPYDAFINYMNILSDFSKRVKTHLKDLGIEEDQVGVVKKLKEKEKMIENLENELKKLRLKIKTSNPGK